MTRFLASEFPERDPADCLFHVIPVPYEASVSYGGGTAEGPQAILDASGQLEAWNGEAIPGEAGIHTWPAVDCDGEPKVVVDRIAAAVRLAMDSRGKEPVLPVVLGGEHTVSYGILRALSERYGRIGIIHLDAHADLRHSYEGSIYSHACVMRRAVADLGLALFQIGVRALSPEEVAFRKEAGIHHLDARELAQRGGLSGLTGPLLPPDFPQTVFVSFDVDAFDSSLMPATGTPEPGGLTWWEALILVRSCLEGRSPVGFDVTELAPIDGMHAPTYAAARLVYELMHECLRTGKAGCPNQP